MDVGASIPVILSLVLIKGVMNLNSFFAKPPTQETQTLGERICLNWMIS
jgi:hypothetical protein